MQLNQPTPTIMQAVHQLQILPPASQQTALDFINFLVLQNTKTLDNTAKNPIPATKKPKRQFGQLVGKGSFKMNDDFEMTEEEFISL